MNINELNSYYVAPVELYGVISCFYDPNWQKPVCLGSHNSWMEILNEKVGFQEALRRYEALVWREAQVRRQEDEIVPTPLVIAARASALMRFIAHMSIDRSISISPDDMEKTIGRYWPCRDYIFAASLTPMRLYANGNDRPFFDPIEFMTNLDLIRKTMGPVLASFSWGLPPDSHLP